MNSRRHLASDPVTRIALSLALVLAFALEAPAAAQDWVGRTRIAGQVVDEEGEPIEGAEVRIWLEEEGRGPEPFVTKKNGRWSFLGITTGLWTVSVEKEGLMPSQGQVQVQMSNNPPIPVTLKEIPEELLYDQRALEAKERLEEGNELLATGDYEGARAKYREGLEDLEPEHQARVLLAIGNSYREEGKSAEALESLTEAKALAPEDPEVLLGVARANYDAGDTEQAITSLEELLDVQPENETALRVLSDMLVAEGRVDEAQAYLDRLPEGTKLDPNAILNVGIDHYNAGEMDEALKRFDQVVKDYPEMGMALYYRGLVYLSREENDLAKADLEKFLEIEPDSPKAAEAREFLSYIE